MKANIILAVALALGLVFAGCRSTDRIENIDAPYTDVSVATGDVNVIKDVVKTSAVRRRWVPSEVAPDTIRCTLVQRQHKVVADIVIAPNKVSMRRVESNIPDRKYQQWANNLVRDIVAAASIR